MLHYFILSLFLVVAVILAAITIAEYIKDDTRGPLLAFMLIIIATLGAEAQQPDTIVFDYHIRTSGNDKLFRKPAFIVIDSSAIFIGVATGQAWRQITGTATGSGERIFYFANGDGLRLTQNLRGEVDGAFINSRGRSWFLGKCEETAERSGWINKTKAQ